MLDNLTRDVLAAERAGMSYGHWKALHPKTKPKVTKKVKEDPGKLYRNCIICGKKFEVKYPNHVMCSEECRLVHSRQYNNKYQEKYRNRMKAED